MKTGSWFTPLGPEYVRVGISRGVPRRQAAGYRLYKALAPGSWFNSVGPAEYYRRYHDEILGRLDPRKVIADLQAMAPGKTPVLVCYERLGSGQWCHRALAAEWLAPILGQVIPEIGFETLPQHEHPLYPINAGWG